jgi:hypothetical protein
VASWAALRRLHAPYRIVLGHLPLYPVAEGRNRAGEVLAEPDSLRALLEAYGVHLYISGHHHAYYPGRRGGLDLLASGALGDGPRPLIGDTVPSPRTVTLLDFDAGGAGVRCGRRIVAGDGVVDWSWTRRRCRPGCRGWAGGWTAAHPADQAPDVSYATANHEDARRRYRPGATGMRRWANRAAQAGRACHGAGRDAVWMWRN